MSTPVLTESTTIITPERSRSWMLLSANATDRFDEIAQSRADQVILDIEDAIDTSLKASARTNVVNWLSAGGHGWVRINPTESPYWQADVDALRGLTTLAGVVLAKAESAESVSATFDALDRRVRVVALIESALGVEQSTNIARDPGVFRLAFGSGDYRRDTGTAAEDIAMAYPRSRLVVASRVGCLPGPIDGPTVGTTHSVLREQTQTGAALGMTGKLCLQTEQLTVVNEEMSPSRSDIEWAQDFIADFDARGRVIRDGSDPPRLGRAERILEFARAFGLVT